MTKSIEFKFDNEDKKQIKMLFPAFKEQYINAMNHGKRCCTMCNISILRPRVWNFFRALFGDGGSETGILTGNAHFEGANKIALYKVKRNWFYTKSSLTDEMIDELCAAIENNQNNGNSEDRQYILDRGHWAEEFIKSQFKKYFDEFYKEYLEEQFGKKIKEMHIIEDNYMYLLIKEPMFADFDGKIEFVFEDDTTKTGILELKTVKSFMVNDKFGKAKCGEFAPANYIDQVQHYMYVDGNAEFAIIVFDGECFNKSGIRFIARDNEYINNIIELHENFWNCVMTETRPIESGKDFLEDVLDKEFIEGETTIGRVYAKKIHDIVSLKAKKAELDKKKREIDKEINILESEVAQNVNTDVAIANYKGKSYRFTIFDKPSSRFNKNKLFKAHPEMKEVIDEYTDRISKKSIDIQEIVPEEEF